MTNTLGIHVGHDGGAAIATDGHLRVACAEERLTRKKYANGWLYAVKYCLESLRIGISDVDTIVFSNSGERLPRGFDGGLSVFARPGARFEVADHHLSHAVGAFAFSGFSDAVVIVMDAGGNNDVTESIFAIDASHVELLRTSPCDRPRSGGLGTTYEAFTNYLGFNDQESGKTMALAAYGTPPVGYPPLFEVLDTGHVIGALRAPHYWGVERFISDHRLRAPARFPSALDPAAQSLAAYVQRETEQALESLVKVAVQLSGMRNVCISGGIALNCVANGRLRSELGQQFFPFGAGSDSGLAVGNALLGHYFDSGTILRIDDPDLRLGKQYTALDVAQSLNRQPDDIHPGPQRLGDLQWSRDSDPVGVATHLLLEGRVIGWFQGRAETGPRALGARSILALPSQEGVRDRINAQVKLREWFRPFGPSILESDAKSLISREGSRAMRQMIEVAPIVSAEYLPECTHVDGTARLHVVPDNAEDRFGELLQRLRDETGLGAVISTSFNIQEPIVETPSDAIATFLRSRMDALILDDIICTRDVSL